MCSIMNHRCLLSIRELLSQKNGLAFLDLRHAEIDALIHARAERVTGGNLLEYEARLRTPSGNDELIFLSEKIAVGETYFFRDPDQLSDFVSIARENPDRKLSILCAGCASGEEAYSLAILLREALPDFSAWSIEIHAIDISRTAIEKALRGVYSAWSLRQTSSYLKERYFDAFESGHRLKDLAREGVHFYRANLFAEGAALFRPSAYDFIFCRNVLMYLTLSASRSLVYNFAGALKDRGFLFLGHAETLRGISDDFALRHANGSFCYQKRLK